MNKEMQMVMKLILNSGSLHSVMDPESSLTTDELFNSYKLNFMNHYDSPGRRPYGIYLHAAVGLSLPNHVAALVRFQKEIAAQYSDVYWINNNQLLDWMQAPTDVNDALKSKALDCFPPATDPSNKEICDGIDNTGNGKIDDGLKIECSFPKSQSSFFVFSY
jgi:hypothetical protein